MDVRALAVRAGGDPDGEKLPARRRGRLARPRRSRAVGAARCAVPRRRSGFSSRCSAARRTEPGSRRSARPPGFRSCRSTTMSFRSRARRGRSQPGGGGKALSRFGGSGGAGAWRPGRGVLACENGAAERHARGPGRRPPAQRPRRRWRDHRARTRGNSERAGGFRAPGAAHRGRSAGAGPGAMVARVDSRASGACGCAVGRRAGDPRARRPGADASDEGTRRTDTGPAGVPRGTPLADAAPASVAGEGPKRLSGTAPRHRHLTRHCPAPRPSSHGCPAPPAATARGCPAPTAGDLACDASATTARVAREGPGGRPQAHPQARTSRRASTRDDSDEPAPAERPRSRSERGARKPPARSHPARVRARPSRRARAEDSAPKDGSPGHRAWPPGTVRHRLPAGDRCGAEASATTARVAREGPGGRPQAHPQARTPRRDGTRDPSDEPAPAERPRSRSERGARKPPARSYPARVRARPSRELAPRTLRRGRFPGPRAWPSPAFFLRACATWPSRRRKRPPGRRVPRGTCPLRPAGCSTWNTVRRIGQIGAAPALAAGRNPRGIACRTG